MKASRRVLVAIANGSEEIEAMSIIGTLVRAEAQVKVGKVYEEGEEQGNLKVLLSRGVKLIADLGITDETQDDDYDAIVLPGGIGGAQNFHDSDIFVSLIRSHFEKGKLLGAICASPAFVLEPHGFLEGRDATCYPALSEKLSNRSKAEQRVVISDNLITGNGPGSAIDFSLALVEHLYDKEKAQEVALSMATTYD
eukprot:CAMPEP_0196994684 /NCGR_PEP_ID=MMETSP1380-20130617/943_1 /TAXON_ID=5936 /ORGANISM="Euplotes crassus, Strain CT5" /LENGTH=195 /DNA_ID=CAMNT_0042410125 /DNA_START=11 /DNA_END=598 /DNA_ORIENTATION=+